MVRRMSAEALVCPSVMSDKDLRRQIDRSVCRALVDGEFARLLLTDPTVILEDHDCAPQQYLSLLSIQADTLFEFARQAQALFWAMDSHIQESVDRAAHTVFSEEPLPLATAS
jgi:hypothetical protein